MAFCSSCGNELVSEVKFCSECGASTSAGPIESLRERPQPTPRPGGSVHAPSVRSRGGRRPYVNSHLTKAIITTLLCCLPLGVIAIVYASSVEAKVSAGDLIGARIASRKANDWGNYSIIAAVVGGFVYLLLAASV